MPKSDGDKPALGTGAKPAPALAGRAAQRAKLRRQDARADAAGLLPAPDAHSMAQAPQAMADAAADTPVVLLPYQQRWIEDDSTLKVAEKGRRVGLTWGEAADDVLIAAQVGGSNVFYISATEDMAREYIEACAMWALHFDQAASTIGEGVYDDGEDAARSKRYIKTYEVNFPATGKRIVALSSRPTNLRGKQGVVVIDEAAYAPDLAALLKAAMAMVMWGDKVRIISTHDGADNPFADLIAQIRAGKLGQTATVHTISFDAAVADGLYRRVCLRTGRQWTQLAQDVWVGEVRRMYADNAPEELDAIPSDSGGAYLPLALIAQRMHKDTPLVRKRFDAGFVLLSKEVRELSTRGWIAEALEPVLASLSRQRRHRFGWDFARVNDLSVLLITEQDLDLRRRVVLQLELSNCPFAQQQQILWYIIDRLPRFSGGAMDAGGNGAQLAEETALRYGVMVVHQIKLSQSFYVEHMPKLKSDLEDGTLRDFPKDEATQTDLRAIRVVAGVPKLPGGPTQRASEGVRVQRHGDVAIAALMEAYIASAQVGEIGWQSSGAKHARHLQDEGRMHEFAPTDDDDWDRWGTE